MSLIVKSIELSIQDYPDHAHISVAMPDDQYHPLERAKRVFIAFDSPLITYGVGTYGTTKDADVVCAYRALWPCEPV